MVIQGELVKERGVSTIVIVAVVVTVIIIVVAGVTAVVLLKPQEATPTTTTPTTTTTTTGPTVIEVSGRATFDNGSAVEGAQVSGSVGGDTSATVENRDRHRR